MKIGVIGASGYSGGELLRYLQNHSTFKAAYLAAGSSAGESVTSLHPQLHAYAGRTFEATSIDEANTCDLVFTALPHGESAKFLHGLKNGIKVVDLGADFRLKSASLWNKYYGGSHAGTWTYGLAELPGHRELISHSSKVANPGCYATSIISAIAPAAISESINIEDIVVVAASGTTGAGRKASANLLGSEVMNNLISYKFGGVHQHTPEIEESINEVSGSTGTKISFTPILAPMSRGILSTVTAKLTGDIKVSELREIYQNFYAQSPFISLLPEGQMPSTSAVGYSNRIDLQIAIDEHTGRLVVSSAIDNLGKGAAGQALQNANLMCGLSETDGLLA